MNEQLQIFLHSVEPAVCKQKAIFMLHKKLQHLKQHQHVHNNNIILQSLFLASNFRLWNFLESSKPNKFWNVEKYGIGLKCYLKKKKIMVNGAVVTVTGQFSNRSTMFEVVPFVDFSI